MGNDKTETTSQRLCKLREEKGLTQEGLYEALNETISVASIKKYEQNPKSADGMSIHNLRILADFYGVSTDYLLGNSPVPSNDLDIISICEKTGMDIDVIQSMINAAKAKRRYKDGRRGNGPLDMNDEYGVSKLDIMCYALQWADSMEAFELFEELYAARSTERSMETWKDTEPTDEEIFEMEKNLPHKPCKIIRMKAWSKYIFSEIANNFTQFLNDNYDPFDNGNDGSMF